MRVAFTERELDVMEALWNLGSGTVAEVRGRLPDRLAYTTVLTVLRTLERKGYVGHTGEGRAHRYRPLVKRATAGKIALRRLVDTLFQGSAQLLLAELVSNRGLDTGELHRMRRLLEERLREERGARAHAHHLFFSKNRATGEKTSETTDPFTDGSTADESDRT
jgi:predicted transcriptional regulator